MADLCALCLVPSAVLYRCESCEFLGCPYVPPGETSSHVQSHISETGHSVSLVPPDSPKKTPVFLLTKANSVCAMERFTFSSFEKGFNIVIFKKPKDPKINEYFKMTLEVLAQSFSKNGTAQ